MEKQTLTLHHRSRERIKDFGEVFTSENYVDQMLDVLADKKRNIWSNESISFFEPTCGHGNIVLAIFKRRIQSMHTKYTKSCPDESILSAIANSINTIWAIDIDEHNINHCRSRLLAQSLEFLAQKLGTESPGKRILKQNLDFIAHLICAIHWHIHENEAISSMCCESTAPKEINKAKTSRDWFQLNGHNPIDFNFTWVDYFKECQNEKTTPIEFQRAKKLLASTISGSDRGYAEYDFAKEVLSKFLKETNSSTSNVSGF
jgi:hypothetical protein